MEPVMINAHFHPQATVIYGTVNGASTAPIFVPELKIRVAKARSFLGNHSATVFMAAGKFADAVTPNALRATIKPRVLLTSAWPTAAKLQKKVARKYPIFVPTLSMTRPENTIPNA